MNIEPFGYFRALPFGWDSCGENDEGAMPLYEQKTVDDLIQWIEELQCSVSVLEDKHDTLLFSSSSSGEED